MMERLSSNRALRQAGVGVRHEIASWDELTPQLLEPVAEYCESIKRHICDGHGLVLVGGYGTGKTCAMALVVDAALQVVLAIGDHNGGQIVPKPARVEWIAGSVLLRILHRPGARDHPERIDEFERAHLLVVDDWHKLYLTDWNVMQLEALMDIRYAQRRATCMTLNTNRLLQREDLAGTRDRLRETSTVVVLGEDVKSRRGRTDSEGGGDE